MLGSAVAVVTVGMRMTFDNLVDSAPGATPHPGQNHVKCVRKVVAGLFDETREAAGWRLIEE
jgi:hypothetical protein